MLHCMTLGLFSRPPQIARAEQLEDATRQLAAEFLTTLCEAREKAPGMMRKLPNFVPQVRHWQGGVTGGRE